MENKSISIEELFTLIKSLIKEGNVSRIVVKNKDHVLVDIPVNAGLVALGLITYYFNLLFISVGVIATLVSDITIEVTRKNGAVDIINKSLRTKAKSVTSKVASVAKNKVNNIINDVKERVNKDILETKEGNTAISYTVEFKEIDK